MDMVFNSHFYYVNDLESSSSNLMGQPFINERFVGSRFSFFHKKWSKNFPPKELWIQVVWREELSQKVAMGVVVAMIPGHVNLKEAHFWRPVGRGRGDMFLTWQIFGNYVVPYTPNGKSLKIEWRFFWGSCNSLKVRNL